MFALSYVVPILLLASVGAFGLNRVWPKVRGTTLVAAWWWAVIALAAIALGELVLRIPGSPMTLGLASRGHYLFAVATFAPTMAIFGAKRPQHFAWQLIVVTLLVVLALPALESTLFAAGPGPLELHAARRWFLAILIAVGVVNYLPTSARPASLAYGLAQICLLADHVPLTESRPDWDWQLLGLGMMVIAFWLLALGAARRERTKGLDRVWLDFRNAYGMVWALRVQDRYNATAAKNGWPVRIGWRGMKGFERDAETATVAARSPDHAAQAIETTPAELHGLTSLLRRFVSREWIAQRLETD
jgi:hypothetical protein